MKLLKAEYLVAAIDNLSQAIIFCRTKLDCDHIEEYLTSLGGTFTNRLLTRLLNTALQISWKETGDVGIYHVACTIRLLNRLLNRLLTGPYFPAGIILHFVIVNTRIRRLPFSLA